MVSIRKAMLEFARDERGLSTTEYGILIAFLGVALVAVVKVAGPLIAQFFQQSSDNIAQQTGP